MFAALVSVVVAFGIFIIQLATAYITINGAEENAAFHFQIKHENPRKNTEFGLNARGRVMPLFRWILCVRVRSLCRGTHLFARPCLRCCTTREHVANSV